MKGLQVVVVAASLALFSGCGSSSGGSDDGGTPPVGKEGGPCGTGDVCDPGLVCASQLCVKPPGSSEGKKAVSRYFTEGVSKYCAYLFRCCERGELSAGGPVPISDENACKRYWELSFEGQNYGYQLAVADGTIKVDSKAVDACISALGALKCGDVPLRSPSPVIDLKLVPECDPTKIFTGARAVGEACSSSAACVSGAYCRSVSSPVGSRGICLQRRQRGDICSGSSSCAEGLHCQKPREPGQLPTCEAPGKVGESCASAPCAEDAYCDYKTRLCRKRKGSGELCNSPSECALDLFCDYQTRVCRAKGKAGAPCPSGPQQCASGYCDYPTRTCGGAVCDGVSGGGFDGGGIRRDAGFVRDGRSAFDLGPPPSDGGVPFDAGQRSSRDYVLDDLLLPRDQNQASAFGYDYDGDKLPDNAIGGILAGLSGVLQGLDLVELNRLAVARGSLLTLLRLSASSFANGGASANVWSAKPLSCCSSSVLSTCRTQAAKTCFSGSTTFAPVGIAAVLAGNIKASALQLTAPSMPLTFMFGTAPVTVTLRQARVSGQIASGGRITGGKVTGGISQTDLSTKLIPAMATMMDALVKDPNTSSTTKQQVLNLFDTNKDGAVSSAEVAGNTLIKTFLAGDVDVDKDGKLELSFGAGFTAVGCVIQ